MLRHLLLGTALSLAAVPALARDNHAILIGANTYENLDQRFWLKGPANDVRLVQTYLTTVAPVRFDAANVAVLADGIDGAPAPTLAAIRAAFADLTARVQPGDFVYLHFSGHGSQAPARDPDSELDGLDELFLPVDIGPWSDSVGEVENALVDDEIGAMLDALTGKGADVWVVFDSCHSGTATRAAPSGDDEVAMRQLPPEALGLSADRMAEAEAGVATRALPDPRARPPAPVAASGAGGSIVAFFAAQTNEVTPEKNLPKGKPGRVPQGVFTWTLFETLAEYPGATYGQIAQEVLRKYAVKNLARSTPLFEGDLDRVAFSGEAAPRVAQWPGLRDGDDFTLPAGTLHGLVEGSRLAVLASAADSTEAALGFVTVTRADTFAATAAPDADAAPPDELPRGIVLRKVSSDLDFSLTVALPEPGSAPADALAAAAEALRGAAGSRLAFVPSGTEADLRLAVLPESPRPDAIWILPATGIADDLSRTPSVSTGDKTPEMLAETLADTLTRMAKAINLMKLGAAVGTGDAGVEVDLLTRDPGNRTLRGLDTQGVPRLVPDDEVHVEARNTTDGPMDLNVLYVGSDWSITHMFAGRMQPGDTLKKGLLRITDDAFGRDRIVMVMTPAKPQSAVENLAYLAQDAVEVTRGGGSGLSAALREAGFGETTRAAVSLDEEEDAGPAPMILQFDIDTVPAD
ncbi:MAG: caspase family protein [Paracoccaceae bacterium]|nr:MAG: caspase family protein [Paracoccaceae bacterium]